MRRLDIRLPAVAAGAAVLLLLGAASSRAQDGVTHRDSTMAGAAVTPRHDGLIEEPTFLAVQGRDGHRYRLEAMIVRKMDAGARLPIALITHGKQKLAADFGVHPSHFLFKGKKVLTTRVELGSQLLSFLEQRAEL